MDPQMTVLLCDDSRAMRMVTASVLADHGFEVVAEAGDGIAAVELFKTHKPDVVLLDLVMPQRDGQQALRDILDHDPGAKVVILSSLGSQGDIEECLRLGAHSYLQKPIDSASLLRVLRELAA